MRDNQVMVFDLEPIEIPIKVGSKNYILCEADGAGATAYQNAQLEATELRNGKPFRMKGFANAEPLLVSYCLYELGPDGSRSNIRVPLKTIQSWPGRIQKALAAKAKEISGMAGDDDEAEDVHEKAGNLPEPTKDGSG